jgi:hypothetical protein
MGWVTAMLLTFALMVSSILLGLFVAALLLSAVETYRQCAEERAGRDAEWIRLRGPADKIRASWSDCQRPRISH